MTVRNVHERVLAAPPDAVGALIDTLASTGDRLWPAGRWPRMRLDGPLAAGAAGGHGPIRYTVEAYEPGRMVRFRFTAPTGFLGTHAFSAEPAPGGGARLRHELAMRAVGPARLTWPLVFRPLHDALLEDALDQAALSLGLPPRAAAERSWSPWVRTLRWAFRHAVRRRRPHHRRAARP